MFIHPYGGTMTVYDESEDEITSVPFTFGSGTSADAASEVVEALGLNLTGGSILKETLTKQDISFKAYIPE